MFIVAQTSLGAGDISHRPVLVWVTTSRFSFRVSSLGRPLPIPQLPLLFLHLAALGLPSGPIQPLFSSQSNPQTFYQLLSPSVLSPKMSG